MYNVSLANGQKKKKTKNNNFLAFFGN